MDVAGEDKTARTKMSQCLQMKLLENLCLRNLNIHNFISTTTNFDCLSKCESMNHRVIFKS